MTFLKDRIYIRFGAQIKKRLNLRSGGEITYSLFCGCFFVLVFNIINVNAMEYDNITELFKGHL